MLSGTPPLGAALGAAPMMRRLWDTAPGRPATAAEARGTVVAGSATPVGQPATLARGRGAVRGGASPAACPASRVSPSVARRRGPRGRDPCGSQDRSGSPCAAPHTHQAKQTVGKHLWHYVVATPNIVPQRGASP